MRDNWVLRRLRRTGAHDQGLTLIEMVMALLVLSVVLAALGTALVASMVAANQAELRTRAVQLAAKYVEADQSINWKFLGHRSTDLPSTTTYSGNGESLVRLANDVDASTVTDIPQSGPVTVTYAGTDFSVQTFITWSGSSSTTPNDGTTYAAKRITIIISWAPRDGTHTLTTVALRAPSAAEMEPPSATSVAIRVASGYATPAQTLSSGGLTTLPIVFTAKTSQPSATVVATFALADGTQQQVSLVGDALFTTWSGTLAAGAGPFAAGSLGITITATAASGTSATFATNLKLLAATPPALTLSSPTAIIGNGQASDAVLNAGSGGYVTAQPLKVSVVTSTTPQSITVSYPMSGGLQSTPVALSYDSAAGNYSYTFPVGTGPLAAGNLTFTFAAVPVGGGASVTATAAVTLQAPSLGALSVSALTAGSTASPLTVPTWPWSVGTLCVNDNKAPATSWTAPVLYVMVKNVSQNDSVTVSLSNITGGSTGPLAATFVQSDANGMTFRVVWPSSVVINPFATTATVRVTRSADGTVLNPLYTSALTLKFKNKASLC